MLFPLPADFLLKARVLQCDCDLVGDRGEQPFVLFRARLALRSDDGQQAGHAAVNDHGHTEEAFRQRRTEQPLKPPDQRLIERLADWEDQRTWEEFYQTYWRLIYSVSTKAGLSREEAFDVVQETVLAVAKQWKKGQSYDPAKGSFKTWLMNLTRWRIADQFRNKQRNPAAMNQAGGSPGGGACTQVNCVGNNFPPPQGASCFEFETSAFGGWQVSSSQGCVITFDGQPTGDGQNPVPAGSHTLRISGCTSSYVTWNCWF